jgi:Ni/Co efflux regulator RcnB
MKMVRIVAALVALIFALCALPELVQAAGAPSQTVSAHHAQARRGHRHRKRSRHHRKHAKSKSGGGSGGSGSGSGLEF